MKIKTEKIKISPNAKKLKGVWKHEIAQDLLVYPDPIKNPEEYEELSDVIVQELIKEVNDTKL